MGRHATSDASAKPAKRRPLHAAPRPHRRVRIRLAQLTVVVIAAGICVEVASTSATPTAGRAGAGSPRAARRSAGTAPNTAPTSGGSPTTTTTPTTPQGSLSSQVTAYLAGRSDVVVAALDDLSDGQSVTLAAGPPQHTASVVKLDILETLLSQIHTGGLPTGTTQTETQQMIEESTDAAAQALFTTVGGPQALTSYDSTLGLSGTTPTWIWGLTTTTPPDQLALLRAVVTAQSPLSATQRTDVVDLMENVIPTQRWGVTGGVPTGVTVALKNGWVTLATETGEWQANSVGWVDGDGTDYLLAVLTTQNSTLAYGEATVEGLSTIVWTALSTGTPLTGS